MAWAVMARQHSVESSEVKGTKAVSSDIPYSSVVIGSTIGSAPTIVETTSVLPKSMQVSSPVTLAPTKAAQPEVEAPIARVIVAQKVILRKTPVSRFEPAHLQKNNL